MNTVPPTAEAGPCSSRVLKITTIVFGAINLAVCGASICMLFYSNFFDPSPYGPNLWTWIGCAFMIPLNFGMIYVTSRLIFLITVNNFPNEAGVVDLHKTVARLVALSITGLMAWILTILWLAKLTNYGIDLTYIGNTVTFHACSYGFLLNTVVAGLAGGLLKKVSVTYLPAAGSSDIPLQVVAPDPPTTHTRTYPSTQPQGHYNEAYSQPSSYYRR